MPVQWLVRIVWPVVDLAEEDWDRVQRVNVKGVFLCSQAVARHLIMQGTGGKIINMSSVTGKRGSARFAAYSASKIRCDRLHAVARL